MVWGKHDLSNFNSNPLNCDPTLFPGKNSPNIANIFSGKGRGDTALILTYLNSPMAEVFPHYSFLFPISAIFKGIRGVKVAPKVQSWVRPFSIKTQILQKIFKQCFCLLEYYLWWEFQQYWTIFGGLRAKKPLKMGHFMDAESRLKALKIFNLTTTNPILMKLTTIMYLHEIVTENLRVRVNLRVRNSVFLA